MHCTKWTTPPLFRLPGRLALGWLLIAASFVVALLARFAFHFDGWYVLWVFSFFAACKLATVLRLSTEERGQMPPERWAAYFLWPGLQPQPFVEKPRRLPIQPLLVSSAINVIAGCLFLWVVPILLPADTPRWARLWIGMIGYALMFLFGLLDFVSAVYRWLDIPVEKLFRNPLASTSLADFWGQRWNRIFSGFARDMIFFPLARPAGVVWASLAVFVFAGLTHEWAWSLRADGGFGGPLVYFLLQWLGLLAEHTHFGRWLFRRVPLLGRVWTYLLVLGPVVLLLHGPFLEKGVLPQLVDMGVPGLRSDPV